MSGFEDIAYAEAGGVAHIRLARPERRNAMRFRSPLEVTEAVARARASDQRVILLSAEGPGFCAGFDFSAAESGTDPKLGDMVRDSFNAMIAALRGSPLPVVTALRGASVGGGVGLALAGDIVVADRSAFFSAPFGNLGLAPDGGTSWFLPQVVGRARAAGMLILGDRIDAARALEWGMIWDVVDEDALMPTVQAISERLVGADRQALADAKRLLGQAVDAGFAAQIEQEAVLQDAAGRRDRFQSEMARFKDKAARRG